MLRGVVLALFLATFANASRVPTLKFNLNHDKLGTSPSPENMSGECTLESQLTDNLNIGATLAIAGGSEVPVKNVFGRLSETVAGTKMSLFGSADMEDGGISGDVSFGEGDTTYSASLDSKATGAIPMVKSVKLNRQGAGWRVTPTVHTKNFQVDLEAAASLGGGTNAVISVKADGGAKVELEHAIDGDTSLKFTSSDGLGDVVVGLTRKLGDADSVKPTFNAATKALSLDWVHALGGGRAVTTTVDQGAKTVTVAVAPDGDGGLALSASAPWAAPRDVEVSLGRKFSASAIGDVLSFVPGVGGAAASADE